jgi:hypothetical protein
MGLEPMPGVEFHWGGTVGGTTAGFAEAREVKLGPFALERVPTFVMPHGFFNLGAQGGAIVGYDLLSEFVVRFDYRHGRAWLKHVEPRRRLFSLDYAAMREAGALLRPWSDGRAEVWAVLPGGAAQARGLRPGDLLPGEAGARRLAEGLRGDETITVARPVDDAWVDTPLPAPEVSAGP